MNGFILYEGPSQFNREPIVAILTNVDRPSKNRKTGPMAQLWILHQNVSPGEAAYSGDDSAICGSCPLRVSFNLDTHKAIRECYVNVHYAPNSIFKSYKAGNYYTGWPTGYKLKAKSIRLGAYGDPGALPIQVIQALVTGYEIKNWTGYTHMWREREDLKPYCMASVDTIEEQSAASLMGWRTFRVREMGSPIEFLEISCPASRESGYRTNCARCGLCNGSASETDRRKNITILKH